jgi:large conductance mechanosensitive channel
MITPPFGFLLGGVDFSNLTIKMQNFVYTDQPPVVVRYGRFIQELIYLFIMALVLFVLVKLINKLQEIATKRQLEEQKKLKIELSDEGKILLDIRNILARKIVLVDEILM